MIEKLRLKQNEELEVSSIKFPKRYFLMNILLGYGKLHDSCTSTC